MLTGAMPMLTVTDVVVDPQQPQTLYILTGDGEMYVGPSMGVLKSIDGGTTWDKTGLAWTINQRVYGHRLAIQPGNPRVLMAATTLGLYRTNDSGEGAWVKVLPLDDTRETF